MKCGCHSHNGFQLSPEGLAQRERQLDEVVDMWPSSAYLDKVGSVSDSGVSILHWEDEMYYDQQSRRHLNGSS